MIRIIVDDHYAFAKGDLARYVILGPMLLAYSPSQEGYTVLSSDQWEWGNAFFKRLYEEGYQCLDTSSS